MNVKDDVARLKERGSNSRNCQAHILAHHGKDALSIVCVSERFGTFDDGEHRVAELEDERRGLGAWVGAVQNCATKVFQNQC